jgi:hypothetical protein
MDVQAFRCGMVELEAVYAQISTPASESTTLLMACVLKGGLHTYGHRHDVILLVLVFIKSDNTVGLSISVKIIQKIGGGSTGTRTRSEGHSGAFQV